ncbi:MAG: restriction endonuclease subunit S [Muribaculaceae bacterium]
MIRIGEFLTRNKTAVIIQDGIKYKRVTIRVRNGGVVPRDEVMGENIGTKKQFLVSKGQFILSKIDARNGAMGIIPAELDGAVVTQDFLPYDIDTTKVNPQYFVLVCTTKQFVGFCQSCSSGTTNRQRIDEVKFLNIKIPIPSLEEQNKLVDDYDNQMNQVTQQEKQAAKYESDIKTYLSTTLKISTVEHDVTSNSKYVFLNFIAYKEIEEWGYDKYFNNNKIISPIYKSMKLKDLCNIGSGGTPSRSHQHYYNGNIPWIKTGEVIDDIILNTAEHISQEAINNSSTRIYPQGSLIIAMYGQGNTRGRTAKLGIDATTNQACAVLFNINNDIVATDYLWYYLQTQYHNLRSMASGNNQPNLNADKIKNYNVIIPPLPIQKEIVEYIKGEKEQINTCKLQAKQLYTHALENFETKIIE